MAPEAAPLLAAAGIILVVAFAASALFRRTHVPDILFLLALGAVLGPVLGVLDVQALASGLPFVAAVAVVMILFDGALEVTPGHLRRVGPRSIAFAATVFTGTTLLCGTLAHLALGLPWHLAFILGMAFGGAGIAIIVPLAQRMGVSSGGMAVILLEAVMSDVLVILGVTLAATVVVAGGLGWATAGPVVLAIAVGAAVGLAGGWLWSRLLAAMDGPENAYMVTLAALLLVYAATEGLGGAGPLAVLLFGVVVGNARRGPRVGRHAGRPVLGVHLVAFHHEAAFFVRAFFFVILGAVMDWTLLADPRFLATGALLSVAVASVRMASARGVLAGSGLPAWDRTAAGILFPMGLVTAAVSVIPHRQFGIPGTEVFEQLATAVILLTNLLATVVVFVASWRHGRDGAGAAPASA